MNATEALKNKDDLDVRLTCGSAWMYWDETTNEWVVLSRQIGAKKNKTLYHGKSEDDAVEALIK